MKLPNFHLSTRITIAAIAVVVAGALVLVFIENARLRDVYLSEQRAGLEEKLHAEKLRLNQAVNALRQDVLFLSNTPPVSGIVRAALNRGYDARDGNAREKWEARLQQIFFAFSAAHPDYTSVRYIGVADGGRELVRIGNRAGKIEITPPAGLQAKGDRDYFKAVLGLHAGEVYLSEFNLNRERGVIEPTLRAATPVFAPSGQVFGMVIISMDATRLLEFAASGLQAGVQAYITNADGEYLLHPDARRSFSFDLGGKDKITADFPFLETMFNPQASEHFPLQAIATGGSGQYFAAERVHFAPGNPARFLLLMYYLPDAVVAQQIAAIPATHIIGGFIAMLLVSGIALLALRRTFAPLEQLMATADKIAADNYEVSLLQNGSGEIGSLSRALNKMLSNLLQREQEIYRINAELENRIRERTDELGVTNGLLKASETRLHSIIDASPVPMALNDESQNITFLNPAFVQVFGYTLKDIPTLTDWWPKAYPDPAYRQWVADIWQAMIERSKCEGMPFQPIELEVRCNNGMIKTVQASAAPVGGSFAGEHLVVLYDVTERKQMEEALRVAAAAFETQDAIMVTGADGNIIRVNQAFSAITGYSSEEVLGKNQSVMNQGQYDTSCIEMLQQSINDNLWTGEVWDKRKNGQIYPKWMTVTAVRNERQEIIRYVTVFSDIIARKQVEKENLRESDERFRGTLEQAAVGIAHTTLDGQFRQINQKFCSIVGYPHDELIKMRFQDITFPDDLDKNVYYLQQLLAGEVLTYFMEKRYVRKDRSLVWCNLTVSLLRDADGTPRYTIGVIEDITERKQIEEKLQKSESQYRRLHESMMDAFVMVDMSGLLLDFNYAYREMLGYSDEELHNLTYVDLTPEKWHEFEAQIIKEQIIPNGYSEVYEKEYIRKDGTVFPVELKVFLLRDKNNQPEAMWTIVRDITERQEAERELDQSRQLLRELVAQSEAFREEERKCLAREVHDELGQILTALRMKISLLRIEFGEHDAVLLERVKGITELLDQSIRCARDVVNNLRPVALDMGIVPAIRWLRDEFIKHTGTLCVLYAPEEEIHLDEALAVAAFRVVQESLTNVARYAEASKVEIFLEQDADNFSVTVNDNGKGFDYLAIPYRKSFGLLGMRERAIALGGVVNIYSAPQQGTQVFFTVPNQQVISDTKGNNP